MRRYIVTESSDNQNIGQTFEITFELRKEYLLTNIQQFKVRCSMFDGMFIKLVNENENFELKARVLN